MKCHFKWFFFHLKYIMLLKYGSNCLHFSVKCVGILISPVSRIFRNVSRYFQNTNQSAYFVAFDYNYGRYVHDIENTFKVVWHFHARHYNRNGSLKKLFKIQMMKWTLPKVAHAEKMLKGFLGTLQNQVKRNVRARTFWRTEFNC